MIRVGIVGYGYWGPNLLRNFLLTENCEVKYVCDLDEKRLHTIKKLYTHVQTTNDYNTLLHDENLDAIIVATPPETHFSLAKSALLAGKDVMVEKPMTTNVKEGEALVELAKKNKRILMVDHTFIYSKAVEHLKRLIVSRKIGRIVSINSIRINLGLYQNNVNVIQDLAIHDFSILDYILGVLPKAVLTVGKKNFGVDQEDQAYVHLWYPKNVSATVHVSWLSPIKIRQMILCGTKRMVVYDDIEASEKIKVFEKGVRLERDPESIYQMKVGYRQGDIYTPYVEASEALSSVATDFVHAVSTRKPPRCDGEAGLRVVKVMDMALHSLKHDRKTLRNKISV